MRWSGSSRFRFKCFTDGTAQNRDFSKSANSWLGDRRKLTTGVGIVATSSLFGTSSFGELRICAERSNGDACQAVGALARRHETCETLDLQMKEKAARRRLSRVHRAGSSGVAQRHLVLPAKADET